MERGGDEVNPYAAPESPVDVAAGRPPEVGAFRSVTPLAQAITGVMALITLFRVLDIANCFITISIVNRVLAHQLVEQTDLVAIDHRARIVSLAVTVLYTADTVLFCFFMPRANRNVRAFGAGPLQFTPGWTVASFFVPILSLYQPYLVMKELWLGSDPDWQLSSWQGRVPARIPWWWGTYVVGGFASMIPAVFIRAQEASDFIARSWCEIVVSILSAAAAVLGATVVRAVASRQEERQRGRPVTAGAAP